MDIAQVLEYMILEFYQYRNLDDIEYPIDILNNLPYDAIEEMKERLFTLVLQDVNLVRLMEIIDDNKEVRTVDSEPEDEILYISDADE